MFSYVSLFFHTDFYKGLKSLLKKKGVIPLAIEMNEDQIVKWKCAACGSRLKKVVDIFNANKKKIGYSIFCCECGHIENFAWTIGLAKTMSGLDTNVVDTCTIRCGMNEETLKHCRDHCCDYRLKPKPKGPSISVRQNQAHKPEHPPITAKQQQKEPLPEYPRPPIRPNKPHPSNNHPPLREMEQPRDPMVRDIERDRNMNPHPEIVPNPAAYMEAMNRRQAKESYRERSNDSSNLTIPVIKGDYSEGKI
jgi:hypothetical protein